MGKIFTVQVVPTLGGADGDFAYDDGDVMHEDEKISGLPIGEGCILRQVTLVVDGDSVDEDDAVVMLLTQNTLDLGTIDGGPTTKADVYHAAVPFGDLIDLDPPAADELHSEVNHITVTPNAYVVPAADTDYIYFHLIANGALDYNAATDLHFTFTFECV